LSEHEAQVVPGEHFGAGWKSKRSLVLWYPCAVMGRCSSAQGFWQSDPRQNAMRFFSRLGCNRTFWG